MSFPVMRTLSLVTMLSAALAMSGCGGDKKVAEPVRPAIAAQPVPLESLAIETYSGDVRARYQSMLGFRIAGKLETRRVNNGERVKKGDVLATLAPEDARLAVSSAEALVASAAADLSLADAELERHRQLLEKNYISKALFDARANQQKAAQARLEQAQAQLQVARNQSQYTRLQADADGVITSVNADVGQVVAPGTPVMSLARSGELEVEIDVPESRYAEFKPGRPLILELWSDKDKRYSGKIREVASEADPATRTYSVRVNFDQADESVQLGMTARVFFTDANAAAAVLIPLSALYVLPEKEKNDENGESEAKHAAWVIDPATRKISLREVRVGEYREDGVSIISGLMPSDWIVTAGVHKLVPGQIVNPIDRENRAVLP